MGSWEFITESAFKIFFMYMYLGRESTAFQRAFNHIINLILIINMRGTSIILIFTD